MPLCARRLSLLLPALEQGGGHAIRNTAVWLACGWVLCSSSSRSEARLFGSLQRGGFGAGQHLEHLGHQRAILGSLLHTQETQLEAFEHFVRVKRAIQIFVDQVKAVPLVP